MRIDPDWSQKTVLPVVLVVVKIREVVVVVAQPCRAWHHCAVKVKTESEGDVHVIAASGEMVTGEPEVQLAKAFESAVDGGHRKVILDLTEVPYIDSSVLGKLVHGHAQIKSQGGALKLVGVSQRVLGVLELTRLVTIFEIHATRQDAIAQWAE